MAGPWEDYKKPAPAQQVQPSLQPTSGVPWAEYSAPPPAAESENQYTGKILPISVDAQGNKQLDFHAGLIGSLRDAFMAPGDAMSGKLQVLGPDGNVTQEAIDRANGFAGAFSGMSPALRSGEAIIPGIANTLEKTAKVPTASELKAAGGAGYDALRDLGAQYSSKSVSDMAAQIQQHLENDGINATTAPKTFANLKDLQSPPDNSIATSSNLETARRTFGQIGQDFSNPTDRAAGKTVRGAVDSFVMSPPAGSVLPGAEEAASQAGRTVTDARSNIAASKRSGTLTGVQDAAELRAASANSGQNVGNSTRQRLASLLLSPKQASGFNPTEIAELTGVVRGSPLANSTRFVGNLLGGGGGLGAAAATGVAGTGAALMSGIPMASAAGILAPIVGSASKHISNAITERGLANVDEATRARSALYEALKRQAPSAAKVPTKTAALVHALLMAQRPASDNGGGGW